MNTINFISMTVPQFVVMAFRLPSMVGAEIGYLVCSASKACIMTGLAPYVNGLHNTYCSTFVMM